MRLHRLGHEPRRAGGRVRADVHRLVVMALDVHVVQPCGPLDHVTKHRRRVRGRHLPEHPCPAELPEHLPVGIGRDVGIDGDRHESTSHAGRWVDRNGPGVGQVVAERAHRALREAFGDLTRLREPVQHRVAHLVDRAGADRVVRRVADHLEPRFVEELFGPPVWGEQQRAQRLGQALERPLGGRSDTPHVSTVRSDSHEEVGARSRSQLALPLRQCDA